MAADTTNFERTAWPSTSAGRVVTARKITRAEELRLMLADEIVSGQLEPGAALDETELAKRFHVSRTPVREALRRLGGTDLVEMTPRKGVIVARIDAFSTTSAPCSSASVKSRPTSGCAAMKCS